MSNVTTLENASLSMEEIRSKAPSVFGEAPLGAVSDKYEFIPTYKVLEGLMKHDFMPVQAQQTGAYKPERVTTNRHMLRFRHKDLHYHTKDLGDSIPEIVLINSHNASCSYRLMFGIFRMVCSNGLIVASSMVGEVKVRHIHNVVQEVIDASYELIEDAPNVVKQIQAWQAIDLSAKQQNEFAGLARTAHPSRIDYDLQNLLEARRVEDDTDAEGVRDLWRTMNVVQENIIKGGFIYQDANNVTRTVREVKALHAREIINRNLWGITEDYQSVVSRAA